MCVMASWRRGVEAAHALWRTQAPGPLPVVLGLSVSACWFVCEEVLFFGTASSFAAVREFWFWAWVGCRIQAVAGRSL